MKLSITQPSQQRALYLTLSSPQDPILTPNRFMMIKTEQPFHTNSECPEPENMSDVPKASDRASKDSIDQLEMLANPAKENLPDCLHSEQMLKNISKNFRANLEPEIHNINHTTKNEPTLKQFVVPLIEPIIFFLMILHRFLLLHQQAIRILNQQSPYQLGLLLMCFSILFQLVRVSVQRPQQVKNRYIVASVVLSLAIDFYLLFFEIQSECVGFVLLTVATIFALSYIHWMLDMQRYIFGDILGMIIKLSIELLIYVHLVTCYSIFMGEFSSRQISYVEAQEKYWVHMHENLQFILPNASGSLQQNNPTLERIMFNNIVSLLSFILISGRIATQIIVHHQHTQEKQRKSQHTPTQLDNLEHIDWYSKAVLTRVAASTFNSETSVRQLYKWMIRRQTFDVLSKVPLLSRTFSINFLNKISKIGVYVTQLRPKHSESDLYILVEGIVKRSTQLSNVFDSGSFLKKFQSIGEYAFTTGTINGELIHVQSPCTFLKLDINLFRAKLAKYPLEKEKYFYIRDRLLFSNRYHYLSVHCVCCSSTQHQVQDCPYIHYKPDKILLIRQWLHQVDAERICKGRRRKRTSHSLQQLMVKSRRTVKALLTAQILIEKKLLVVGNQNQDSETSQSLSSPNVSKISNDLQYQKSIFESEDFITQNHIPGEYRKGSSSGTSLSNPSNPRSLSQKEDNTSQSPIQMIQSQNRTKHQHVTFSVEQPTTQFQMAQNNAIRRRSENDSTRIFLTVELMKNPIKATMLGSSLPIVEEEDELMQFKMMLSQGTMDQQNLIMSRQRPNKESADAISDTSYVELMKTLKSSSHGDNRPTYSPLKQSPSIEQHAQFLSKAALDYTENEFLDFEDEGVFGMDMQIDAMATYTYFYPQYNFEAVISRMKNIKGFE